MTAPLDPDALRRPDEPSEVAQPGALEVLGSGALAMALVLLPFVTRTEGVVTWLFYAILGAGLVRHTVLWVFPARFKPKARSPTFSVVRDAAGVMLWLYATGGVHSEFHAFLYLAVVSTAFRFPELRTTLLAAALYSIGYALLVLLPAGGVEHLRELALRLGFIAVAGGLGRVIAAEFRRQTQAKLRAERSLEVERTRLRLADLVESSTDAIIGLSTDGRIESWNPSAERIYGYPQAEVLGRRMAFLSPPGLEFQTPEFLERVRVQNRGETRHLERVRKDGRRLLSASTVSPLRAASGELLGFSAISRDITESEAGREALRAQTELYEKLLKSQSEMGDGVAITQNDRFLFANEALARIYGYPVEELLALPSFMELIVPEERTAVAARAQARLESGEGPHGLAETTVLRRDGTRVDIEYAMKFTADPGGVKVIAIIRDVTARKRDHAALWRSLADAAQARDRERARAEDLRQANQQILDQQLKLIQAEKLASVGKLAAGVAHEINNPVTGLMGCVRLLQTEPSEARRREYLGVVSDGLKQIARTVNALLHYAREQPAAIAPTDLREVVSSCLPLINPVLRARRVELDLEIEPGTRRVSANSALLGQAALNVLLNAVHASAPQTRVQVTATSDGGRIGLRFIDHGEGIAPEHLAHVCDPFFTTRPEGQGVGLGLSVAQAIVTSSGGELEITSEVGRGTTVTFWLEASPEEAPRAETYPSAGGSESGGSSSGEASVTNSAMV